MAELHFLHGGLCRLYADKMRHFRLHLSAMPAKSHGHATQMGTFAPGAVEDVYDGLAFMTMALPYQIPAHRRHFILTGAPHIESFEGITTSPTSKMIRQGIIGEPSPRRHEDRMLRVIVRQAATTMLKWRSRAYADSEEPYNQAQPGR